jgi:chromosome segregation protein
MVAAVAATRREAATGGDLEEAALAAEEAAGRLETERAAVEAAEDCRRAAQDAFEAAREAWQTAAAARARTQAEAEALEAVLGEPATAGGGPPVLDAVTAEAGYEQALGAALGDDLSAPQSAAAAVHWVLLPPLTAAPALPEGCTPLARHVQAPEVLARRLAQVGVVDDPAEAEARRLALAPGQRLVCRDGGLWRWDGFTLRPGAPTAAAVRLRQKNRLAELRAVLAEAEATAAAAEDAVAIHRAAVAETASAVDSRRAAVRGAAAAAAAARDRHADLARRVAIAESRGAALSEQVAHLQSDLEDARRAAEEAAGAGASVAETAALRSEVERLRGDLTERRRWLAEARSTLDRVCRDTAERRRRLTQVAEEMAAWRARGDGAAAQRSALDDRHRALLEEIEALAERPLEIARQRESLDASLAEAEAARRQAADALAIAETALRAADHDLREAEKALAAAREERVRAEAAVDQGDQAVRGFATAIAERLDCTPAEAKRLAGLEAEDGLPSPTPPAIEDLERRLAGLGREREAMGPVNLRAEQEAEDLAVQMATLVSERDDLLGAIDRLRKGIADLNREGRQRLVAAFEKVDTHFRRLFTRLFGGGRAHLALTESDDPLEAGLEIFASPPGKRLQILSLLSGGEQAMTAIALLFAVFLVNPAPICVLDEVDAPLDDANVDRFCTLLSELTRAAEEASGGRTRFLVVTHHRMTMARMDRLFGVTMGERGVSKLVSVDLREAERLRDAG